MNTGIFLTVLGVLLILFGIASSKYNAIARIQYTNRKPFFDIVEAPVKKEKNFKDKFTDWIIKKELYKWE